MKRFPTLIMLSSCLLIDISCCRNKDIAGGNEYYLCLTPGKAKIPLVYQNDVVAKDSRGEPAEWSIREKYIYGYYTAWFDFLQIYAEAGNVSLEYEMKREPIQVTKPGFDGYSAGWKECTTRIKDMLKRHDEKSVKKEAMRVIKNLNFCILEQGSD